jgi:hypothetical protein
MIRSLQAASRAPMSPERERGTDTSSGVNDYEGSGFGADAPAVADLTGAFVNPDPVYLQSTGLVLDPAGKVVVSVYSSGAIGRLVPDDVAGLVRYLRDHAAASA